MPAHSTSAPRAVRRLQFQQWPWPLPALGIWAAAWGAFAMTRAAGLPTWGALATAALLGTLLARPLASRWRRCLAAGGFPLSVALAGGVPAWSWLAATVPLALAYPVRAWRDAPFFPTPSGALAGLQQLAPLPDGARVLDAGCGLGHAIDALRAAYPRARIEGVEWSRPLAALAVLRCRFAHIRRGDMWAASWTDVGLVYVFQRPESMTRVWQKACRDMVPGRWLVSLEFAVPGVPPAACLQTCDRVAWIYRIPSAPGACPQSPHDAADNPPMPRARLQRSIP